MDALLLALLGLLAIVTAAAGGRPGPELGLLAIVALAWVAGRTVASLPVVGTATLSCVAAGAVIAALLSDDGLSGEPLAGPLGYGNANGTLCLIATGALLAAATGHRSKVLRWSGLAGGGVCTLLTTATASSAATTGSAAVLGLAVALHLRPRWSRLVPLLAAAAVLATAAATVVLGAVGGTGLADAALSARRSTLWGEALKMVHAYPWNGVGAGRFADLSQTAALDDDGRWAHSVWLQQAAETGVAGGVLLLVAGLVAVLLPRQDPRAALGAAVMAAVLVQSSIDYVLHFPVVAGLLVFVRALTVTPVRRFEVLLPNR